MSLVDLFWSPSGKPAEARELANKAVVSLSKSALEVMKDEIFKAASMGRTSVFIYHKRFDFNSKVMDLCAKELRSQGYRVTNRYVGMGILSFTISW